ncbi:MAG: hypothetical protein RIT81_02245 [Deltaproteobacteria bacterium]
MKRIIPLLLLAASCIENEPVTRGDVKFDTYRCQVQPIVDAKCSMLACHGDVRRPFHSFTRNRMRLEGSDIQRDLPLTQQELDLNYASALGFVTDDPDESWLLLKPLDSDAGGYYHRGKEIFGGPDVFSDTEDPDYQIMRNWLAGAEEDPACVYPGTEG